MVCAYVCEVSSIPPVFALYVPHSPGVGGLSAGQSHIWLCFTDPGFNLDSFSLSTSSVAFGSASMMPFGWAWQVWETRETLPHRP